MKPNKRVLVVDDEADKRESLRISLSDADYSVDLADSVESALTKIEQEGGCYEYVIMDHYFPGAQMDGLEGTRIVSKRFPSVKVLFVTSYGLLESPRVALDAGAYRYIFRPCDDEQIVAVMQSAEAIARLEASLREKSLLLDLMENAAVGISIIDRSYRLLYMNARQKEISRPGCKTGGICWNEYNLNFTCNEPCAWCPSRPAMMGNRAETATTVSVINSVPRYYRVTASPIHDEDGKTIGAIEYVSDITKEIEADRATLEASEMETRLKAVVLRVCALGFARARLYEVSEDGTRLIGRVEHGGMEVPIGEIELPVKEDPYTAATIELHGPRKYTSGELGPGLREKDLGREGLEEWVEVPLIANGPCLGKIVADNRVLTPSPPGRTPDPPRPIDETHFDELIMIAGFAAREIRRERKSQRVLFESERLKELRRLSDRVMSRGESGKDLQAIAESCAKLTGTIGVHLRLMEDGALVLKAGVGPYYEAAQHVRAVVTLDDVESGSVRCWRAGAEVVEPDAAGNHHFQEFVESVKDVQMRSALDAIRSFACFPILFDGRIMGILCLQADRTGYFGPRVEDAVRDYAGMIGPIVRIERYPEELRAAEKRLRDAAATAAHKLNNPSFTIQKRVEVWQDRQRQGTADPAFTEDTLRVVGEQAAKVGRLVKDLRAFLTRPAPSMPSRPIDLNRTIQRIVSGAMGGRPEFRVEWDLSQDLSPAYLDEKLIADILDELVANACKAMRDGGVITIRTRAASEDDKIQHSLWTVRPYLRVDVQDSGPGIPPEKKARIFEAFHTGFLQGTGLGLSIVRNSVDALQGAVWEEGVPKLGAHFVILLPVARERGGSRK